VQVDPLVIALEGESGTADAIARAATLAPISGVSGAVIGQQATAGPPTPDLRPTIDPALGDITPPTVTVQPLPIISPPVFTVRWSGQDNGQIISYLIWVRVDGGDWQLWLETDATQADYTGTVGRTYDFAAWAQDAAGNWSSNTELAPQASTAVQG
ncbi:MAG: hypothetical protein KC519_14890, partial [Anaerolineae bacterium]|nr:hypothetical protein [Anaerolineae bacterium]